jgi:hypothetical protein
MKNLATADTATHPGVPTSPVRHDHRGLITDHLEATGRPYARAMNEARSA